MAATAHLYEIFIKAPRERVWDALLNEDDTVRYFHGTRFESSFEPGAPFVNRIVAADRPAAEGVIETIDPPHRLVYTWRPLYDEEMSNEPPGRVEWTLTPANDDGSVTRVTLRHGDLALSPKTWEHVRLGWVEIIDGLKTVLETGEALPDVDLPTPSGDTSEIEGNWHRAQGVTANNSVWELLDGRELGPDAADDLLERAYAAAYHWRKATGASVLNRARASWLISRCHSVLGHGEIALHHADRCVQHTKQAAQDAEDFDHAYAYEARARALACLGRLEEAGEAHRRAATVRISDEQDRAIFEGDLAAEPWFGLVRR
jgi:uncharacterized protein YndB with AHSA1/START domain